MPREHKPRGRRADKKRKLEQEHDDASGDLESLKRQRIDAQDEGPAGQQDYQGLGQHDAIDHASSRLPVDNHDSREQVFYGMLDEEEQEYFRKANEIIELNSFAAPDERQLFVDNVFKEAQNKELKLANSQSGSRLLERLLQLATPAQLKDLFQKFNGHFANLIQHRFASHCCEKLFTLAAPIVSQEFLHPPKPDTSAAVDSQPFILMEDLFLHTVVELKSNVGFLMTDRFATHTLRVLLLVLAGEPASSPLMKSILQSKRKEDVTVENATPATVAAASGEKDDQSTKLAVPESFTEALSSLIQASVAGLDTNNLRALAKHEQANPMLQLLLRIELTHFGKSRGKDQDSIIKQLLPDDTIAPESETAIFINDLIYDSIGSHLVETIIEFAPAKIFKNLFRDFFKERIAALARNDIASYVACKVLERLSRDDLIAVHELLIPALPRLLELNRVNVLRTLIERCQVRKVETQAIAVQLQSMYVDEKRGFDIVKFLHVDVDAVESTTPANDTMSQDATERTLNYSAQSHKPATPAQIQGNLLAQAMILVPGPLSSLIFDSISLLPPSILLHLARTPVSSRTLQAAMKSAHASIISRRKLIQQFYGHAAAMSLDPCASHVVDAIWDGTYGLAFIRERIAEELAETESTLRESLYGRAVWRNWKMDLYRRRRAQWVQQSRNMASDDGFQSFGEIDRNKALEERRSASASASAHRSTGTGTGTDRKSGSDARKDGQRKSNGDKSNSTHGPDSNPNAIVNGSGAGYTGSARRGKHVSVSAAHARGAAATGAATGAGAGGGATKQKTPLELARERHANKRGLAKGAAGAVGS